MNFTSFSCKKQEEKFNFWFTMSDESEKEKSQLRILREEAGFTLTELGREVGVSDRNIWDWERGLALPRLDRAVALAKALKITLPELCQAMGIEVEELANTSPLRQLREAANLTQEQLSVRLGVSTSTLRRWENGDVEPAMTRKQWQEFCEAVGVAFNELPRRLNLRSIE